MIKLNGKDYNAESGSTIGTIIDSLNLKRDNIIAEYNGEIVTKDNFDNVNVTAGGTLELVRFVGGG